MFPHLQSVVAYRLLFGVYSGIVPDGIDDLVVDDIDWAGDATILLSYVKGPHRGESVDSARAGGAAAGAVAGPLGAAARPPRRRHARHLWIGVEPPRDSGHLQRGHTPQHGHQRWVLQPRS